MTTDPPFWSDDFDMDLPKVFPAARRLLGELADVEVVTTGTPDRKTGRLNHPSCWNGDGGQMLAYFGFRSPSRPPGMVAPRSIEIRCTAWEAFRDAWPHGFLMIVESEPLWDTGALWPDFERIMWAMRGWNDARPALPAPLQEAFDEQTAKARARALRSYAKAVRKFEQLVWYHGVRP